MESFVSFDNQWMFQFFYQIYLLLIWYQHLGLIQGRGRFITMQDGRLSAMVNCLEEDSLHPLYHSLQVRKGVEKLEQLCGNKLHTRLVASSYIDDEPTCKCVVRDHFVLVTQFLSSASPLKCGACDRTVPLYKIPIPEDGSHYPVLKWMDSYQACDTLQNNCQVGEKWAMRQMQDVHSELSTQGRDICARIEQLSGTPTYYYLFNYRKISLKTDRDRPCPNCNGPWLLESPLHKFYDFLCQKCRLISNVTMNPA